MIDTIETLKNNQILYYQNVIDIKECIRQRYPHYTQKHAAELFAAAIHKIIDKNIAHFDNEIRTSIKETLLEAATKKDVFAINAYDVLEACTALELSDEQYLDNLTEWINQNQTIPFSKHEVADLICRLKGTEDDLLSFVPPVFEESLSLPQSEKEQPHFLNRPKFQRLIISAASLLLCTLCIFNIFKFNNLNNESVFTTQISNIFIANKPTVTHLRMMRPRRDNVLQKSEGLHLQPRLQYKKPEGLHLHPTLQYKTINKDALVSWLTQKNSILAQEPYFSSIIGAAEEYNINPLLLFAITGQEQSFVPKSNPQAAAIANNPFNVYGSWRVFNTDITNTARIAARTILTLSKGCPKNEDPVKWINKKYAEDPNWYLGVSNILMQLEETAGS